MRSAPTYGKLKKRLAAQLFLITKMAESGRLTGVAARMAQLALRWTLGLVSRFRPAMASTLAIGAPLVTLTNEADAQAEFVQRTGVADPFAGLELFYVPSPVFADIDGDGDSDLVVGDYFGDISYLENTSQPRTRPSFAFRSGDSNPFELIDVGDFSAPAFADMDNDGDLDAIVGESYSQDILNYFLNEGSERAPHLLERLGLLSPVDGLNMPSIPMPVLADVDGDGDSDLLLGTYDGDFRYFQNTGTKFNATFTERGGALNPFDGLAVDGYSTPAFADIDRDGDLDLVSGDYYGGISFFENTGSTRIPRFQPRVDAANPFAHIDVGFLSDPTLADVDSDGDVDLVVGEGYDDGLLRYYENIDPGPASGFPAWQQLNFTFPGEAALAAPEADPDGDGRANLVEFGLRSSPRLRSYVPVISPGLNTNGLLSHTLVIREDPALRVLAEFSDSPEFTNPTVVVPVILDPFPGDNSITATFVDALAAAGAGERYMRLVFELE